jgi:hypothetical protein
MGHPILLRVAVAAWAGFLVAAQLLGLVLTDPARAPLSPERLREALAAQPSRGRVIQLRSSEADPRRSFPVELPDDWWPHPGRRAAPEAFFVFVDGRSVAVVDEWPVPQATTLAERPSRVEPTLLIHCRLKDACREAWIVRRSSWLPLVGQLSESWSGLSALLPFSIIGALAAIAIWALAQAWPPMSGLMCFGGLAVLTAVWAALLRYDPMSVILLMGAELLLAILPPGVRSARRAGNDGLGMVVLVGITCLVWVGVLFEAFEPGNLSADSLEMYVTGVTGHYRHNVYPIAVSFLYGIAGRVFGSPSAILLAQLVGLSAGMALLAQPWSPGRRVRGFIVLCGFLIAPPIWWVGVVLWSDVALAVALLWCLVALARSRFLLGLLLLLSASVLRHNAVLATAPLMAFAIRGLIPASRPKARLAAWSLAAAVGLAAPNVAASLSRVDDVWPLAPAVAWDIISVSQRHPEVFESSVLSSELQPEQVHLLFSLAHANPLFNAGGGPPGKRLDLYRLRNLKGVLMREWWSAVRAHPLAYLDGRISMFLSLLDIPRSCALDSFSNPPGYEQQSVTLINSLQRIKTFANQSLISRRWLWCLVLVVQAVAAFRREPASSLRPWITLSGLCYLAGFFPVGQGCDFRFLYWPIVCCFAAAALPPAQVRIVPNGNSDRGDGLG